MSTLDTWVHLRTRKTEIEAELRDIQSELRIISDALIEEWVTEGVASKKTIDGTTVSISRRLWARPVGGDRDRATRALAENPGTAHLVTQTVNLHSLSSHFRQIAASTPQQDIIPPELRDVIEITYDTTLSMRKGN